MTTCTGTFVRVMAQGRRSALTLTLRPRYLEVKEDTTIEPRPHIIGLSDIIFVRTGSDLPPADLRDVDDKLDEDTRQFWLELRFESAVNLEKHTFYLLVVDIKSSEEWCEDIQAAITAVGDDPARASFASESAISVTGVDSPISIAPRPIERKSWIYWRTMARLNQDEWTYDVVSDLETSMQQLTHLERTISKYEAAEVVAWAAYIAEHPEAASARIEHDIILNWFERDTGGNDPNMTRLLQALYGSRRLKAVLLDKLLVANGAWSEASASTLEGHNSDVEDRPISVGGSRFWALLIGINQYLSDDTRNLTGCVNDVRKMEDYLVRSLGVPDDHIRVLTTERDGAKPTRATILNELYNFRDRVGLNIQPGDTVLVQYSGHGSAYEVQPLTFGTSRIQAWCPMDRNNEDVYDISDREISDILSDIRTETQAQIVLMFDCCHAAGFTRSSGPVEDGAIRLATPLNVDDVVHKMLDCADSHERRTRPSSTLSPSWTPRKGSHVLLAACQSFETAKETVDPNNTPHGAFTCALLNALNSLDHARILAVTFADLVNDLMHPPIKQMPSVTGCGKDSALWFAEAATVGERSKEAPDRTPDEDELVDSDSMKREGPAKVEGILKDMAKQEEGGFRRPGRLVAESSLRDDIGFGAYSGLHKDCL